MPSGKPIRKTIQQSAIEEVKSFICKHIEPDENPGAKTHHGYDWFYEYFSFIPETEIREQLAQAYYQSRYVHKLLIALKLDGRESYPLLLLQLFEYASIYEALTDYIIEKKYISAADFQFFKKVKEIKKFPQLNTKNGKLVYSSTTNEDVFFAYEKEKELQLRDIRYSDRINYLGEKLGLLKTEIKYIAKIYDLRNHIHLLKAAGDNFSPDHTDGKKAFKMIKRFIIAVKDDLHK